MARSKKHLYSKEDQYISESAKALFHPARLKIIRFLHANGTKCVTDISAGHPISREGLTGHLNALYEHKLVTYAERFPFSFYTLEEKNTHKALLEIQRFCNEFLKPQKSFGNGATSE